MITDKQGFNTETYHLNQSKLYRSHSKWFCGWNMYHSNRIITLSEIRLSGL